MRQIVVVFFLLLLETAAFAAEPVLVPMNSPAPKKATEILVRYRPGAKQAAVAVHRGGLGSLGLERLHVPSSETASSWAQHLRQDSEIAWAEPNHWRSVFASEVVPNDPYYRPERNQRRYQQWYLPKINANFAWSVAQGSDQLTVAVIDTGVDLNHPDLKSRLLPGITLITQTDYTPTANGMDDHGHGTGIAGMIAAATDNHVGMSGCSWMGKILPVKVLNNQGQGTDADIVTGILWAVDAGARILNLSLGGPSDDGSIPQALQDAVDYAYSHGCIVFAAAGNSGDNTIEYPAALNHVVAVAALDPWDRRAPYSTFGSFVGLAAPGGAGGSDFALETGMLSTYWDANSQVSDFTGGSEAGEYAVTAGTSDATAVVSGVALVVWGYRPELSNAQLENLLKATAVDVGAPGPDQETGVGRVDMLAALGNPAVEQPDLTLYNYPNPFNPEKDGQTRIVFKLSQPTEVDVKIFDAGRSLVWSRHLNRSETMPGKNYCTWDGKNSQGVVVANGVYFYHLTTTDGTASRIKTIAVLR